MNYNLNTTAAHTLPENPAADQQEVLFSKNTANRYLKLAIYAYFLLLIFEGALRKWILPGLATPLLLSREPVAVFLVIAGLRKGYFYANPYITGLSLISVSGMITALVFGHGNLMVALFGARVFLLHFPIIFVIGKVFRRSDIISLGKLTVWLCIPMSVLITLQFYSPQSAWVNRGVGGDMAGAGFSGAMGYLRPPATFSFTNGTSLFFSFCSCFIFYFWVNTKHISRAVLSMATAALLIAIPISISRALLFQVVINLLFIISASAFTKGALVKILSAGFIFTILLVGLSQTDLFQTSTEAFIARFDNASGTEGGLKGTLGDRYLGGMLATLWQSDQLPFWGYGIGMGTNVGSMLLSGSLTYMIAEGEWGRMTGELGPLLGIALIMIRLSLCWDFAKKSLLCLKEGDVLPWILLSFALLIVPQGSTSQPTSLGFLIMTAGLLCASVQTDSLAFKSLYPSQHGFHLN